MKGYVYQSEFARLYVIAGKAQALLTVLQARGVTVPDTARARIDAEKDLDRLDRWVERAATAASIGDVLGAELSAQLKGYVYQSEFARSHVVEGKAQALLTVLQARGVTVPDAVRARIDAEKDLDRLDRWVERAATAASIGDVLDEPS